METLRVSSEIKMVEGYTDRGRALELARVCDARELEATVLRAWMTAKADDGKEGNKQLKDHRTGRRFDGATGLGFVISSAGRVLRSKTFKGATCTGWLRRYVW